MLWRPAFLGLLAVGFALVARPADAASFDCAKAASAMEKLICANPALGKADDGLAEAYAASLKPVSDAGRKAMRDGERQWLRFTARVCGLAPPRKARDERMWSSAQSSACLTEKYATREWQIKTDVVVQNGVVIRPAESFIVTDAPYVPVDDEESRPGYEKYPYRMTEITYPVIEGPAESETAAFNQKVAALLKSSDRFVGSEAVDTVVTYQIYYVSRRLISIDLGWSRYDHGAPHGNFGGKHLNWLLDARRALRTEDLFDPKTPWLPALDALVAEALDQPDAQNGHGPYSSATPKNIDGVDCDIGSWAIKPAGLVIDFPISSIGFYAEGEAVITVPWSKLRPYLAPGAMDLVTPE